MGHDIIPLLKCVSVRVCMCASLKTGIEFLLLNYSVIELKKGIKPKLQLHICSSLGVKILVNVSS